MSLEGIAFGKSRADCRSEQVDFLLRLVDETREVPGDIVELGSWKCGCSIAMASANPEKIVYAFDFFGGLPYGHGHGFENFGGTSITEIFNAARPYTNLRLVRGMHEFTIPAHPKVPLSLIFLDSDHYSSHRVTLDNFAPLVSKGGYIAFHDWSFPEVQLAIRETVKPEAFEFLSEDVYGMRSIRAL